MNYGLPYKGSKSRVIKWLLPLLPDGEIFVDLMCGGCSVTHAALLSHKYKRYIINDINPLLPTAFVGALNGRSLSLSVSMKCRRVSPLSALL